MRGKLKNENASLGINDIIHSLLFSFSLHTLYLGTEMKFFSGTRKKPTQIFYKGFFCFLYKKIVIAQCACIYLI